MDLLKNAIEYDETDPENAIYTNGVYGFKIPERVDPDTLVDKDYGTLTEENFGFETFNGALVLYEDPSADLKKMYEWLDHVTTFWTWILTEESPYLHMGIKKMTRSLRSHDISLTITLGGLKNLLETTDKEVWEYGFCNPHSFRDRYDDVAFEPASYVPVSKMLSDVNAALKCCYTGYHGGEFKYYEGTTVHFTVEGTTGSPEMALDILYEN